MNRFETDWTRARQPVEERFFRFMTKVILAPSDEMGGCRNARLEVTEALAEGIKRRGQEQD